MIITIDGPMASGKSTVARALAEILGFSHLNSGLIFRAAAYLLLAKSGYTLETIAHPHEEDVIRYLDPTRLTYRFGHDQAHVLFDGEDITPYLKQEPIDRLSSLMGSNGMVRSHIVPLLRAIADGANVVVDGRDTGSVIFPHAEHTFYLTASPDVRAKRWITDQQKLGHTYSLDQALAHIELRDSRDKKRAVAPLIIPVGAQVIDNSDKNLQETVNLFLAHIKQ